MSQEKVTVVASGKAKAGRAAELFEHVKVVVAATRAEAACINYDFHQSTDDPDQFMFYENWTSLAGLQQHGASAHIATFRANIADLLEEPIQIKLFTMLTEPVA